MSAAATSVGVVSTDAIRRAPVTAIEVGAVVGDDHKGSARRERVGSVAEHSPPLGFGKLEVRHEHEVERGLGWFIARDVGDDGLELDAARRCERGGLVERDVGEVDGRRRPSTLRQPDRVAALPRGEVQRPAGPEVGGLGNDELVGVDRPHQLGRPVAVVPGVAIQDPKT